MNFLENFKELIKRFEANKDFYIKMVKFMDYMTEILEEKRPKYNGFWKITPLEELKKRLEEQVKNLTLPPAITTIQREKKTKRTLAHIANLSMLMYFKFDLY